MSEITPQVKKAASFIARLLLEKELEPDFIQNPDDYSLGEISIEGQKKDQPSYSHLFVNRLKLTKDKETKLRQSLEKILSQSVIDGPLQFSQVDRYKIGGVAFKDHRREKDWSCIHIHNSSKSQRTSIELDEAFTKAFYEEDGELGTKRIPYIELDVWIFKNGGLIGRKDGRTFDINYEGKPLNCTTVTTLNQQRWKELENLWQR